MLTDDASLITVGQETLLKADRSQDEILWPMGTESSFTVHTVMQTDSCFVEGLQGKADSDVTTLDDDTECCCLEEKAVVCSESVAELPREVKYKKIMIVGYMIFSNIALGDSIICFLKIFIFYWYMLVVS